MPPQPTDSGGFGGIIFLNDGVKRLSPSETHESTLTVDTGPDTEDLAAWIHDHPRLKATTPTPVTVAGIEGEQFDVVVRKGKGYQSADCGPTKGCVLLLGLEPANVYVFPQENKLRVISLDVNGEPVVIMIESAKDNFDEFATAATEVLDNTTIG